LKIFYLVIYLDEQIRLNRSEYLVLEVQVPDYCVGSIIGKGGEVIKRVRRIKTNIILLLFFFTSISFNNNFPFVVHLQKMMKKLLKKIIEY